MKFHNLLILWWLVLLAEARPNEPSTTTSASPSMPKPIAPATSPVTIVGVGSLVAGAVRGSLTGIFTGRKPAEATITPKPSALTSAAPVVQDSTTSNSSCSLDPDSPCPLPKASAVHTLTEEEGSDTIATEPSSSEVSESTTPEDEFEETIGTEPSTGTEMTSESTTEDISEETIGTEPPTSTTSEATTAEEIPEETDATEPSVTEDVSEETSEEPSEATSTTEETSTTTWASTEIPTTTESTLTTEYPETSTLETIEASTEDPDGGPQMTTSEPISPSDDPTNPCRYEDHLTALTYTCCRKKKYQMPTNYLSNFEQCFEQPRQSELSVGDTLWEIHECLINHPDEQRKLGLEELAEFMTEHFDEALKQEILSKVAEVAKSGFPQGDSSYDETKKIVLAAYYHIERGICENNYSPPESKLQSCQVYKQNYHARSDCCRKSPIPIRLDFFRSEYIDRGIRESLDNETAEKPQQSTCVQIPQESKFHYESGESVIQQLCSTYCGLVSLKIVDTVKTFAPGDTMTDFDVKGNLDKLLKAFSTMRSYKIKAFMNITQDPANYTLAIQERLQDYGFAQFADVEIDDAQVHLDNYPRLPFMTDVAKNWMVYCEGWNELVRNVEAGLQDQCDPAKDMD